MRRPRTKGKTCREQTLDKLKKKLVSVGKFSGVSADLKMRSSYGTQVYKFTTEIQYKSAKDNAITMNIAKKRKRTNPVFFTDAETRKIRTAWKKGVDRFSRDGSVHGLLGTARKVASHMKDAVITHIQNARSEAGNMKKVKPHVQRIKDVCYGPNLPRWIRTGALLKSFVPSSRLIK